MASLKKFHFNSAVLATMAFKLQKLSREYVEAYHTLSESVRNSRHEEIKELADVLNIFTWSVPTALGVMVFYPELMDFRFQEVPETPVQWANAEVMRKLELEAEKEAE